MDHIQTSTEHRYAFGPFVFDPANGELREDGKATQLRPQVAKLLELLLHNPDNIVSREEIRNTLWDEKVVVEFEEGISACVRQLRVALNDGVSGIRYVQTIARRGYKFVAPVQIVSAHGIEPITVPDQQPLVTGHPEVPVSTESASHRYPKLRFIGIVMIWAVVLAGISVYLYTRDRTVPAANGNAPGKAVIAVLPFDNLSGNARNSIVGASISNDLIDLLGPIAPKRMAVIAYTSVMHFSSSKQNIREIGRELGADYILEGSVTQTSDTMQISARLIRADSQSYVWGDEFDMDVHNDSNSYQEIAIRIAAQVAKLLAPDATVKPSAYTHSGAAASAYEAGRIMAEQGARDKAYQSCVKAAALDPDFAVAYVCQANLLLTDKNTSPQKIEQARKLVGRALHLDDGLSSAHSLQGVLDLSYAWDLSGAHDQFRKALRLNPADPFAWQGYAAYLAAMGQKRRMRHALDIMQSLDPASNNAAFDSALFYYVAGEYDEAVRHARISVSVNNADETARHLLLLSLLGKGEYVEASRQTIIDMQLAGADAHDINSVRSDRRVSLVSYFKWYASRLATMPSDRTSAVFLADAYMHLGQSEQALTVISKAVKQHQFSILIPFMSVWPTLHPLCKEPRFIAMTNQLGQPGCEL
jgi:TolB-like protein/DNA-binding winged helix-turn-helix (wHTH) protein/thioredoxin-like negative regulator of GroEL